MPRSLSHAGRAYEQGREGQLWQWGRVAEHRGGYGVRRSVDRQGQVSNDNRNHYAGKRHQGQPVGVLFDAATCRWVLATEQGLVLKETPADELQPGRSRALTVTHRR